MFGEYIQDYNHKRVVTQSSIGWWFLPTSLVEAGYDLVAVDFEGDDPVFLLDRRGKVVKFWEAYASLTDLFEIAKEVSCE